jgi:hypothetical protein
MVGEIFMLKKVTALVVALALPAQVSAGPIREAIEKAARQAVNAPPAQPTPSRTRFWTGIALIGGGGLLTTLCAVEIGDDETGPDDGEDFDDSDDGEDSDGWGNNALIGSGVAAAGIGGWLLITGRRTSPSVSARRGSVVVRHTIRF